MKHFRRLAAALAALCLLAGCGAAPAEEGAALPPASSQMEAEPAEALPGQEYRAMWISFLEFQSVDFSTEEAFRNEMGTVMQNCADLGLNTVIVQVRPYGDALYPSELFPWSDLCTGTQGQAPGFDPLAVLLEEAHARDLRFEAWINPYRIRLHGKLPGGELAQNNPAMVHPDWAETVGEGLYLNPALPEVQQYIVDGVTEILERYQVDGIHFDDYFYPTTEPEFDAEEYAALGGGLSLEEWRRGNVDALMSAVYDAAKAHDPAVTFGVSPQGNPDNNYSMQYSDVARWMAEGGFVDYVMPQIYWGYGYTLKSGSDRFAFENITAEWAALPRSPSVALYYGLGAFRIGDGDGCDAPGHNDQWNAGDNLSRMVSDLRVMDADGYALFRYDFLYKSGGWPELAAAETAALTGANQQA